MPESLRSRFGRWLEQFAFLHPALLRYSHDHPEGHPHYINRISRTFAAPRA